MAQSERLSAIERVMELATPAVSTKAASLRFWYGASIAEFLATEPRAILGDLSQHCGFAVLPTDTAAWRLLGNRHPHDRWVWRHHAAHGARADPREPYHAC